jgi:DNA polymerase-3 subunit epsilon
MFAHYIHGFRLPPAQEALARQLSSDGNYRVLRRLPRVDEILMNCLPDNPVTLGVLDTETTGLDPKSDELVEVAITVLAINRNGEIYDIEEPRSWLEQPFRPLEPRVMQVTGLTDADLAGQRFDTDAITSLVERCDVLVSHNARFDRAFLARRFGRLVDRPWGCTVSDMDWLDHGLGGRSLGHLLYEAGHFYEAHRAGPDSWALACLLAGRARDGRTFGAHLIDAVRTPGCRIRARHAPFAVKDLLKARGYKWDAEQRCWWIDVPPQGEHAERAWLAKLNPQIEPAAEKVTAYERHL